MGELRSRASQEDGEHQGAWESRSTGDKSQPVLPPTSTASALTAPLLTSGIQPDTYPKHPFNCSHREEEAEAQPCCSQPAQTRCPPAACSSREAHTMALQTVAAPLQGPSGAACAVSHCKPRGFAHPPEHSPPLHQWSPGKRFLLMSVQERFY